MSRFGDPYDQRSSLMTTSRPTRQLHMALQLLENDSRYLASESQSVKSPPDVTRTNRMLPPSDQPLGSSSVSAAWAANWFTSERTVPFTAMSYV
jgi:hypothetical protein